MIRFPHSRWNVGAGPLAEFAPDLEVSGVGRVRTLAARVGDADLGRVAA